MKLARIAAQSRARLDDRFAQFGSADRYRPPARGWIKAIRDALGMSTARLARRMGVRQPGIIGLERSSAGIPQASAAARRAQHAPGGSAGRGSITDAQVEDALRDTNPRLFWD